MTSHTVLSEGDAVFSLRPALWPTQAAAADIVGEIVPPPPFSAHDRVLTEDAQERAALEAVAPAARVAPFRAGGFLLVRVRDAIVLNWPRTEGMVLDREGKFLRSTRGSPRIFDGNPLVRFDRAAGWYFRDGIEPADTIDRAFLGYCPAAANYAHFLGLFVMRVFAARRRLNDTAFLFPDLPEYRMHYPSAMRNEFMFRLPEIAPLESGNFYLPMPAGAFRVRELFLFQPTGDRWDLMFQPEILDAFAAIGHEALRRAEACGAATRARLPQHLYVSRQGATRRRIVNHDDFAAASELAGFEPRRMEALDFWSQAAHFAAARQVLTVHGAGCASILFAKPETALLEMYPRPLPTHLFVHPTLARGCRYVPVPSRKVTRDLDIEVDLDTLSSALGLAG